MGDELEIVPVTPDRWDDLVALFEKPGPRGGTPIPGNCWCSAWRGRDPILEVRRQRIHDEVEAGLPPGLLAYADGQPVGWIAIAPREQTERLETARVVKGAPPADGIWSVSCFYVEPDHRDRGLAGELLDAAIDYAEEHGAQVIEGYPKAGLSTYAAKAKRNEENDNFMGRRGSFESRQFVTIREAGPRLLMRRQLDSSPRTVAKATLSAPSHATP